MSTTTTTGASGNEGGGQAAGQLHLGTGAMYYNVVHARIEGLIQTITALCILNIPLCLIVIATVIIYSRRHDMVDRVSFRLSATIAFADMMYSIIQLLVNNESFTDKLSELQLRALFFFHLLGFNALIFVSTCIAFHLHLTALLNKQALARRCSPWYELVSWALALAISQAMFYVYDRCLKFRGLNIIIMADRSLSHMRMTIWLMYCWCAIALLYCVFVCVLVIFRLLPIWKRVSQNSFTVPEPNGNGGGDFGNPEPLDNSLLSSGGGGGGGGRFTSTDFNSQFSGSKIHSSGGPGFIPSSQLLCRKSGGRRGKRTNINERRRREIRFAVFRIALYSITPIVSTCIMPIYLTVLNPSISLANVTVLLPNLGGLLNFTIFIINPQLDPMWRYVRKKLGQVVRCQFEKGLPKHTRVRDDSVTSPNVARVGGSNKNSPRFDQGCGSILAAGTATTGGGCCGFREDCVEKSKAVEDVILVDDQAHDLFENQNHGEGTTNNHFGNEGGGYKHPRPSSASTNSLSSSSLSAGSSYTNNGRGWSGRNSRKRGDSLVDPKKWYSVRFNSVDEPIDRSTHMNTSTLVSPIICSGEEENNDADSDDGPVMAPLGTPADVSPVSKIDNSSSDCDLLLQRLRNYSMGNYTQQQPSTSPPPHRNLNSSDSVKEMLQPSTIVNPNVNSVFGYESTDNLGNSSGSNIIEHYSTMANNIPPLLPLQNEPLFHVSSSKSPTMLPRAVINNGSNKNDGYHYNPVVNIPSNKRVARRLV